MPYHKRFSPDLEQKVIADYLSKLSVNKIIAPKYGITNVSVYNILRRNGITKLNGSIAYPDKNESYLDEIDTEEKAYLVGLIASDGCVDTKNRQGRIRIALQEEDRSVIDKYGKILLGEKYCSYVYQPKPQSGSRKRTVWLDITSRRLTEKLAAFGIGPNKSFNCDCNVESLNEDLFRAFLLGVSDGDGSLFLCKREGHVTTMKYALICSQKMALKIFHEVKKYLGISFRVAIKKCGKGSLIYLLLNARDECLSFLNWLYARPTDCLQRKRETYLEFKQQCADYRASLKRVSKYKYITLDDRWTRPRWKAYVVLNKKKIQIGQYDTEEIAYQEQQKFIREFTEYTITTKTRREDVPNVLTDSI